MPNIVHRIGIKAPVSKVYDATILLFGHRDWREEVEFMATESTTARHAWAEGGPALL